MSQSTYTTARVDSMGKPLAGTFERKYRADDEASAAELSASNWMTRDQYSAASVTYNEDGVWTFTPGTGAPVHIRVTTDDAADRRCPVCVEHPGWAHGDESRRSEPRDTCRACFGSGTRQATTTAPAPEGPRSECCGEPMSPENRCENCGERGTPELQTWDDDDVDVVARTELLHPITHPYRVNEVVEYHGPSGIGSWVRGPLHFRRMVESDMAEIMTMSGPKYVEVADLRRPSGNIAIELAPEDIPRIFQALALEAERLAGSQPEHAHAHAVELRDRFAALHP